MVLVTSSVFDELGEATSITTVKIGESTYALVASLTDDGVQIIDITDPSAPSVAYSVTDGDTDSNNNTFDELDGATDITTVQIGTSTYALVAAGSDDGVQIIRITAEPICEFTLDTISLDFGIVNVGTTSSEGSIAIQNSGNIDSNIKIGADFWCEAVDNGCTGSNGVISPNQTRFGTTLNEPYADKTTFAEFEYDNTRSNPVRGTIALPFMEFPLFTLDSEQIDTVYLQTHVELIQEDDESTNRFMGDVLQEIIIDSNCD